MRTYSSRDCESVANRRTVAYVSGQDLSKRSKRVTSRVSSASLLNGSSGCLRSCRHRFSTACREFEERRIPTRAAYLTETLSIVHQHKDIHRRGHRSSCQYMAGKQHVLSNLPHSSFRSRVSSALLHPTLNIDAISVRAERTLESRLQTVPRAGVPASSFLGKSPDV